MSPQPRALLIGPTPPPEGGIAHVVADCQRVLRAGGIYDPVVVEIKHAQRRRLGALNFTNVRLNMQLQQLLRSELAGEGTAIAHMHASVGSRGTVLKHILLARTVHKAGVPLLLQPHSGAVAELLRCAEPTWKLGMHRLLGLADTVVVTSQYWLELMQQHWPRLKYAVLPNGVDTQLYAPAQTDLRDPASVHVLFIGHLTEYKGLVELGEAWRALSGMHGGKLKLDIAGEVRDAGGEQIAAALRELPGVQLHGRVDEARKLELLQRADIFVLPSHYENLPLSLLEAMAGGVGCIASAVGAVPEMLEGCGVVIEPRRAAALQQALEQLVSDDVLRRSLGQHARQRALEQYSMERFAAGLHELYAGALR